MPDPEPLLTLRRGGQDAQAAGRARRGGAPRRDRAAPGEHRHPRRPQDRFDPVKEEIVGDEEANRLVNPPMRAPWHL